MNSLNYIDLDKPETEILQQLVNHAMFDAYKRELLTHLSFLKYFKKKDIGRKVEEFDVETYLSAYSTSILAYNYFLEELKQLKVEQKWGELFDLVEKILKYNPGDEKIFKFLDNLSK